MTDRRRLEAAGIWLSHGLLDALSTAFADAMLGPHLEPNPAIRWMLYRWDWLPTVLVMLVSVLAVAIAYAPIARSCEFPVWYAPAVIAAGTFVAASNVLTTMLVLR
jgi:hypothetical protein